ncbi:PD40 domain-containing protein [Rufibacter sp. LB8]|uniref:PD40 domain-containing protein n=1 Tax=Rufibacter sp. LB8 TaxID=2777781 RepID=UPI00178C2D48|nr:PD40 domain-containing protein [Rufibacter sp. LB8]
MNLGNAFNTFELACFFSPDGKYLYFASFSKETPGVPTELLNGEGNIYRVRMKELLKLVEKQALATEEKRR